MKRFIFILIIQVFLLGGILGGILTIKIQMKRQETQQKVAVEKAKEREEEEQRLKEEEEQRLKEEEEQRLKEEEEQRLKEEEELKAQQNTSYGDDGLLDLESQLTDMLSRYEGDWSVFVKNIMTNEYFEINSHPVKAASLIKLYIMGAVLEKVEQGELQMDDSLEYNLNAMITVSDNEASNELVRRLVQSGDHTEGMAVVNAFNEAQGYLDTHQGRALGAYQNVSPENENYTSVKDCGLFLDRIYRGECVSAEYSDYMLELLLSQTRTWKIPAGVPEDIVTANKTGELDDTENDVAIIFGNSNDYILCVMATDLSNPGTAQQNISEISRFVYQYFEGENSEELKAIA